MLTLLPSTSLAFGNKSSRNNLDNCNKGSSGEEEEEEDGTVEDDEMEGIELLLALTLATLDDEFDCDFVVEASKSSKASIRQNKWKAT